MDLDESMDAFKAPTLIQRKKENRKMKINSKKAKQRVNTASVLENKPDPSNSLQPLGRTEKDQASEISLSIDNKEDYNADGLFPCKTCGKLFEAAVLKAHATVCLRVNFEACRLASGNIENLRCRNRSKTENEEGEMALPISLSPVFHEKTYFCPTCSRNLSSLTELQRNTHANRCLDQITKNSPVKKFQQQKTAEKITIKPKLEEFRCQMCTKVLRSRSGYKRHLLRCQKMKGFSTMSVLALNRPEKDEEIDVDLLAEIQRSEMREQEAETSKEKTSKKRVRKQGNKNNQKDYEDEMMRLAMRVSKGEDLTKKVGKREKTVLPSVLSSISPNSKKKAQKHKIQEILGQEDDDDDSDIPPTPALPPTSLKFSSMNDCRTNSRLVSGVIDAQVGVSSNQEMSTSHPPSRQDDLENGDILSVPQAMNSRCIHNSTIPPPIINLLSSAVSTNNLAYYESALDRNGELQSPEVSSSNINNQSVSDPCDNTVNNNRSPLQQGHEREFQCSVSNKRQLSVLKPSKWTMTSESHDQDWTKYKVSGLLSQFERGKVETDLMEPVLRCSSSENSEKVLNSPPAGEKTEDDLTQDIDCTLLKLENLDNGGMVDKDIQENDITDCYNTDASTSNPNNNANSFVEYDPLSGFTKAIDSPLCSDGRIILGKDQDPLHVHLIILFSRCPALYEEVVSAKDNTLFLPEYSKLLFMPFIHYVYSGKTAPYVLSKPGIAFSTFHELAQRFHTQVVDLSQTPETVIKSQPEPELPAEDSQSSQNSVISCDKEDQEENTNYFPSQPSPSQRDVVKEESEPVLLQPEDPDPTEDDLNSDADLFEGTDYGMLSSNSLKEMNPLLPDKSEFDCDGDLMLQFVEKSDEQKVEEFPSEESFPSTQTSETEDHLSDNDCSKPKTESRERRREMRSRHPITPSRRSRRSSSSGRRQQKRRSTCPCCETDSSPHPKVSNLSNQWWKRSLKTQKVWPTSLSKRNRSSLTPRKRLPANAKPKLKASLTDSKHTTSSITPAKEPGGTPASKRRKCTSGLNALSKEKKKPSPGSSQSSIGHSETVYVSERLPRFKQREHIRSRPAVANMGKGGIKFMRSVKKDFVDNLVKNAKHASKAKSGNFVPKRLSLSQPLSTSKEKPGSEATTRTQEAENEVKRVHKLKKKKLLRSYVNSSDSSPKIAKNSPNTSHDDILGYDSDCGSSDITFDDLFNEVVATSPSRAASYQDFKQDPSAAHTPLPIGSSRASTEVSCTDPVPITPMPNFDEMDTPEVRRNACHYGIKKNLGKAKIKTKLKEAYMYTHQVVSDGEDDKEVEDVPFDELEMDVFNLTNSENASPDEDGGEELKKFKHTLSRLSASPQIKQQVVDNMYSFDCLTAVEVKSLSTSVVDKMHMDKTLLDALHAMKNETGSIKRGSRKDKERCWGMVTPGSSGYDPKMNAILKLPEEYQSAITDPLVSCIVKNYIDYKKFMFDCLPVLCDRMEEEMG